MVPRTSKAYIRAHWATKWVETFQRKPFYREILRQRLLFSSLAVLAMRPLNRSSLRSTLISLRATCRTVAGAVSRATVHDNLAQFYLFSRLHIYMSVWKGRRSHGCLQSKRPAQINAADIVRTSPTLGKGVSFRSAVARKAIGPYRPRIVVCGESKCCIGPRFLPKGYVLYPLAVVSTR